MTSFYPNMSDDAAKQPDQTAQQSEIHAEGWDSRVLTDTIARGGRNATARYQILTRVVERRTGAVTTFGTLAKNPQKGTQKEARKGAQKGVVETPQNEVPRAELSNFARGNGLGNAHNRRSDPTQSATVIVPYGTQNNDRDREDASASPTGSSADASADVSAAGEGGSAGAGLRDYVSMASMASRSRRVVIGFDTEFTDVVDDEGHVISRDIVSYQASTVLPSDPSRMLHLVVLPLDGVRLRSSTLLREVIVAARLWEHVAAPDGFVAGGVHRDAGLGWGWHDAKGRRRVARTVEAAIKSSAWPEEKAGLQASVIPNAAGGNTYRQASGSWRAQKKGEGCGATFSLGLFFKNALKVDLVSHFGNADLSTFLDHPDDPDLMMVISAGGGLVSDRPKWMRAPGESRDRSYPISVSIRDTIAHAPAGQQSLAALGEAAGVPKIKIPRAAIEGMRQYLMDDSEAFLLYSSNDAEIVTEYVSRLWGEGYAVPMTLPAAAASSLKASASEYLGIEERGSALFNARFCGLRSVEYGLSESEKDDHLTYYREKGMEPLNMMAGQYQHACTFGFRGGKNSSSVIGPIVGKTYDHDLENAYPTAMSLVPDLDFEDGCISRTIENTVMTPEMLSDPTIPFVGEVRFEFPEDVEHPCLPVPVDGSVIYPRSSDGLHGVHVMGPEVWLALKLGARVFCLMGYFGRPLYRGPGEVSRSLGRAVRQLIDDRSRAKAEFGKKSLEELLFKTAVNSGYGKVAQQVSPQRAWNAMAQEMGEVAGSGITSPHHASTTTSLVRAMLLAAMNQLHEHGYQVYSVTTDGFITDCPLDVLQEMDLYGLTPLVQKARVELTGDPQMWDVKHEQEEFLNGSTRLNISRSVGGDGQMAGVMAHGGFKGVEGVLPDSQEDRDWMHDLYITRTGRLTNSYRRFTPFSQLSSATKRKDFVSREITKQMSMDYDMKREPIPESVTPILVESSGGAESFEVARVQTRAWASVAEYRRGKATGRAFPALRTAEDWKLFFLKLAHGGVEGRRIADVRRSVLMSVLIGHRRGSWEVPNLSGARPRAWKLDWLNAWGLGEVRVSDWDNARRPERESQMLPREQLEPWLSRMIAQPEGTMPTETSLDELQKAPEDLPEDLGA